MNVVVENPAGPLSLGVSGDNPYKNCPASSDSIKWVYFGEDAVQLDDDDIALVMELEKRASVVRALTAIDFFISLLNFTLYGYVFSVLTCMVSYIGYHGAALYRRSMIIGYLVYQVLLSITRCTMVIYVFKTHTDTELMVITPISYLLQLYITWYVWKFYSILPNFGF